MNGPSCLISRWDGWDDPGKIHSLNLRKLPNCKGKHHLPHLPFLGSSFQGVISGIRLKGSMIRFELVQMDLSIALSGDDIPKQTW